MFEFRKSLLFEMHSYWLDADPPGTKQHADVNETNDTIEVMVIENYKD